MDEASARGVGLVRPPGLRLLVTGAFVTFQSAVSWEREFLSSRRLLVQLFLQAGGILRAHYVWRHVQSVAEFLDVATARAEFALPGTPDFHPVSRPVILQHLHLDVAIDPDAGSVTGCCTMLCVGNAESSSAIRFDASDLEISEVRIDGSADPIAHRYDGRYLDVPLSEPLPFGGMINVAVTYRVIRPALGLYFVGPTAGSPDTPVQVWSQNQDDDARYWMPCMDDPGMKMTTSVRATVPISLTAISNGVPGTDGPQPVGKAGWHAFLWQQTTPHPIYLFTLLVGPFEEHIDAGDSPELRWYTLPKHAEASERAFKNTRKMLNFFSEFTSRPYAWPRYGQVAVDDFVFGGMENTTLTTVTTRVLPDERASLDFSADSLVAHELAHQWFGDLVTCREWSHAWLNEGFATYFDALYQEHDLGRDEFHYQLLELARGYFAEDSGRYSRAIITRQFAEPIDVFDRHLYYKGAWV
ncbi:MAG: aminopeptidase N, partial [Myxococcota bacterium]